MAESAQPYDLITMGRVGVDLYALQSRAPLAQVETFGEFQGGSASKVTAGDFRPIPTALTARTATRARTATPMARTPDDFPLQLRLPSRPRPSGPTPPARTQHGARPGLDRKPTVLSSTAHPRVVGLA